MVSLTNSMVIFKPPRLHVFTQNLEDTIFNFLKTGYICTFQTYVKFIRLVSIISFLKVMINSETKTKMKALLDFFLSILFCASLYAVYIPNKILYHVTPAYSCFPQFLFFQFEVHFNYICI